MAVVLGELLVRWVLIWQTTPVVAVLCPPVFAVLGAAAAVSPAREALGDAAFSQLPPYRGRLPSLIALSVIGHVLALLGGLVLFFLVDTPVRFMLYALARGDLISAGVVAVGPLIEIAIGTLLVWVIPGIAVIRCVEGESLTVALRNALAVLFDTPRTVVVGMGFNGYLALVGGLLLVVFFQTNSNPVFGNLRYHYRIQSLFLTVLLGGVAVVVLGLGLAVSVSYFVSQVPPRPSPTPLPSTGRLLIAGVVVLSLAAGAGAIRASETRPLGTGTTPLPDDADRMYAAAVSNTFAGGYEHRAVTIEDGAGSNRLWQVDRRNRQVRYTWWEEGESRPTGVTDGSVSYATMGLYAPGSESPFRLGSWTVMEVREADIAPGYAAVDDERLSLANRRLAPIDAEGWTVIDRSAETVMLEIDLQRHLLRETYGYTDHDLQPVETGDGRTFVIVGSETGATVHVQETTVRVVVDRETGELRSGTQTVDVRIEHDAGETSTARTERHRRVVSHSFQTETDVTRPADLGPVRPGEWVWRLLAY
ncbi:hypothetical protein ACFPYI_12060 [Halomarina salina]|uniref:Uncharacterized protein n=1 Tax=Halomarina salina TaxID=1872699 RepID=A0ABD5RNH3_9EURY|nr:hypothetical protein [Halomarina salina]